MKFAKEKTIIALGILLVLLPLTGFPRDWKTTIGVIIGIVVIYMGLLFFKTARAHAIEKKPDEIRNKTFTETA